MKREELLRQRKNVIYVLLASFSIGFFATFLMMDIPSIYFSKTYSIKINDEYNGQKLGVFKKMLSNEVYIYADNCDKFYDGIAIESITMTDGTLKIKMGEGLEFVENMATITVRNTNIGELFNITGAALNVDDTLVCISLGDVLGTIGYGYKLNSITKTIKIMTK